MRKIYAFLAAALISVCAFASKDVVPSTQVIYDACGGEQGQVVACIFVPANMACYDIVFVGTYNNWAKGEGKTEDAKNCKKFVAIDNYDGWYAVAVDDETESPEGKPVMLDADGNFNWAYQIGAATVISGSVTVVAGLPGEIDLKTYGKDVPNVYTVDAWKQNPCTAIYHNYTVQVISTGCDLLAVPFLIGGMNNWNAQEMQIDVAKTQELQVPVYYLSFKAAEETEYQLLSGLRDPNTGLIDSTAQPGWYDAAYLQVKVNGSWQRYEPSNSKLGAEAFVNYDLREDTLQWARCDETPAEQVIVTLKAPAGAPEIVEIIGGYDGWTGSAMAFADGVYTAQVEAKGGSAFKFRSGIGETDDEKWANQILYYYPGTEEQPEDAWLTFGDGHDRELIFEQLWEDGAAGTKVVNLDFSDPDGYKWAIETQGIENVVLTEKANKVMVDGILYIVRDNKLFNVQGTQVR